MRGSWPEFHASGGRETPGERHEPLSVLDRDRGGDPSRVLERTRFRDDLHPLAHPIRLDPLDVGVTDRHREPVFGDQIPEYGVDEIVDPVGGVAFHGWRITEAHGRERVREPALDSVEQGARGPDEPGHRQQLAGSIADVRLAVGHGTVDGLLDDSTLHRRNEFVVAWQLCRGVHVILRLEDIATEDVLAVDRHRNLGVEDGDRVSGQPFAHKSVEIGDIGGEMRPCRCEVDRVNDDGVVARVRDANAVVERQRRQRIESLDRGGEVIVESPSLIGGRLGQSVDDPPVGAGEARCHPIDSPLTRSRTVDPGVVEERFHAVRRNSCHRRQWRLSDVVLEAVTDLSHGRHEVRVDAVLVTHGRRVPCRRSVRGNGRRYGRR